MLIEAYVAHNISIEKVDQCVGNIFANNMITYLMMRSCRVGVEIRRPSTLLSIEKDILCQEL